ncbi:MULTISPECIES: hypothetical protein [Nocardia]|uniref:Uncharacterized protein n=1 Tax=Nocardia coubleae TaxID=356147 RepID=A0A846W9V8_9NOCA|nr:MULTISPECIES: hypothetical protein [Nocardia]MCA2208595.1 hypothetical protein [Nocardia rosealba]NKX89865.1 hypothetical protein [Nocardia coubleae]
MTDAIHLPATASSRSRGPALRGQLVAESERDVSVRVDGGTWTFDRRDILRLTEERAAEGRQVQVDIRPGATADFTRRMRVELVERPITLAPAPSEALGDEQLAEATRSWAAKLRIAERGGTSGATFTFHDGINCDSLD